MGEMRKARRAALIAATVVLLAVTLGAGCGPDRAPRNVIVLIGDGMGFQQVRAASFYATGEAGKLAFERYYRGESATYSADSYRTGDHATDSAAAATAIATGRKTRNGALASDPDGRDLPTVLEYLRSRGRWTGLVTTAPITHATPAGFGAHVPDRGDWGRVAEDYFQVTQPNVLFGAYEADAKYVMECDALAAGYGVVHDRAELKQIVEQAERADPRAAPAYVLGMFASAQLPWEYDDRMAWMWTDPEDLAKQTTYKTVPHLSEMAAAALKILGTGPDGFFLMIEGGAIDKACHANDLAQAIDETLEFEKAFQAVMDWAKGRTDTLVIVTADHETGGLWVVQGRKKGYRPKVVWGTKGHSGINVPVYAWGPGAERLVGVQDDTQLYEAMTGGARPAAPRAPRKVAAKKK